MVLVDCFYYKFYMPYDEYILYKIDPNSTTKSSTTYSSTTYSSTTYSSNEKKRECNLNNIMYYLLPTFIYNYQYENNEHEEEYKNIIYAKIVKSETDIENKEEFSNNEKINTKSMIKNKTWSDLNDINEYIEN